jgi:hypothetical protein
VTRSPYLLTVPLSRVCEWRGPDEQKCGLQSVHVVVMVERDEESDESEVTTMEVCGLHTDAAHALFAPAGNA